MKYGLAVLAIALLLDYLIGDPWHWIHPVQVIGIWIDRVSKACIHRLTNPLALKGAGVFLALSTIGGTGLLVWALAYGAGIIHPLVRLGLESILVASGLAGRSLRDAANDVLGPLQTGELDIARQKIALYVGRDTQQLGESDILRAVMETVSENATDGVLAPFLFAIVGLFLPTGSAALVLAYKAASTLDSMVGYKTPPYTELGWCSARLEDGLTWIPCRLVVATVSLLSGQPRQVWALCCRDAPQDPSPNAGWSECAYAAAVGVQLGGTNYYNGQKKEKPLLGDRRQDISPQSIHQALQLTRRSLFLWMGLTMAIAPLIT